MKRNHYWSPDLNEWIVERRKNHEQNVVSPMMMRMFLPWVQLEKLVVMLGLVTLVVMPGELVKLVVIVGKQLRGMKKMMRQMRTTFQRNQYNCVIISVVPEKLDKAS